MPSALFKRIEWHSRISSYVSLLAFDLVPKILEGKVCKTGHNQGDYKVERSKDTESCPTEALFKTFAMTGKLAHE